MHLKEAAGKRNVKTGSGVHKVNESEEVLIKKRCWTSSQEKADEKLLKRQKVESTERVAHGENWPVGKAVLGNFQKTKSVLNIEVSKLMLENQRLKLESKYRTDLHAMETDALKLVTELRTENRLLKKEISRLEKENHSLLSRRESHGGLDKNEIKRRLKTFPWLPIYSSKQDQSQSTLSSKGNIQWKELPTNVAFSILKLLPDEDLFVLRGLSTQFYEAFYGQEDHVDCERCIWLAKRGRKFVNLKFIHAFDDFTWKEFRVLGQSHFPKLEVLWLENSSPRLMKSHPNLRELQFTAHEYDDLQWVSDKKFPALEVLIFSTEDDLFEDQPNRLQHLPGHKNLTHFGFDFCEPSVEEIRELTKVKFPRLRIVGINGEVGQVPEVLEYLQQAGIEFTDNIKNLSLNQSSFRD